MTKARPLQAKCARCGHGWSFHGKAVRVVCKAMGCKGGKDGGRCAGFVAEPVSLSPPA